MEYIIYYYITFLAGSIMMPFAIWGGNALNIIDCPDSRKIHTTPIPRTGGIIISICVLVGYYFFARDDLSYLTFMVPGLVIFIFGLVDDFISINYKYKFTGQILASCFFVYISSDYINFFSIENFIFESVNINQILNIIITIVFIVGSINIVNLSDGLDALAAGLSIINFIFIGIVSYIYHDVEVLYISILMVGSILSFLRFNVFPASIFMGDTGSQFIGVSLGISIVLLLQGSAFSQPIIVLFILGVPLVDTLFVILLRLLKKKNPFLPDKNHIHHHLVSVGMSQDKAVACIYFVHFVFIIGGWFFRDEQFFVIIPVYLLFLFALFVGYFFIANFSEKEFLLLFQNINSHIIKKKLFTLNISFFSKILWNLFFGFLALYYILSPFMIRKLNFNNLFFGFILFTLTLFLFYINKRSFTYLLKIFFYGLNLFLLLQNNDSIQFCLYGFEIYIPVENIFFAASTLIYIFCTILTREKAPINSIDYIVLISLCVLFFCYSTYDFKMFLRYDLIKVAFLAMFINLVFSRIKRNYKFVIYSSLYVVCTLFLRNIIFGF